MNVYDFDMTIYRGNCTLDFYLFCLKKDWRLLRFLPAQCWAGLLFLLGRLERGAFKERFYRYMVGVGDIDEWLAAFWQRHLEKIAPWYIWRQQPDDVIISASPAFLLAPACQQLHIRHLIASAVDPATGDCTGPNCYGEEKVRRFRAAFGEVAVDEFYSDSLSDRPMALLAKKSYIVRRDRFISWHIYEYTVKRKRFDPFLKREFPAFLFIGCFHLVATVLLAALCSLRLAVMPAFVVGFLLSITIAYLLHAAFSFRTVLSFGPYLKFFLAHLPSFIGQLLCLHLFYNVFGWRELIAYALTSCVGLLITSLIRIFLVIRLKYKNLTT